MATPISALPGLTQQQFDDSGFVVDVADSGIDNGTTSPEHFGLYTLGQTTNLSRVIYSRYETNDTYDENSLEGCDGHGNINAHIIAGYDDFSGFPFADAQGLDSAGAIDAGMKAKADEFREKGGEIYVEEKP